MNNPKTIDLRLMGMLLLTIFFGFILVMKYIIAPQMEQNTQRALTDSAIALNSWPNAKETCENLRRWDAIDNRIRDMRWMLRVCNRAGK